MDLGRAREQQVIHVDCKQQLQLREPEAGRMLSDGDATDRFDSLVQMAFPKSTRIGMAVECLVQDAHRTAEAALVPLIRPEFPGDSHPSLVLANQ